MFQLDDNSQKALAIFSYTDQGDEAIEKNDFDSAISFYKKAWEAIPKPKKEWELAHWVMSCIGVSYYDNNDYNKAIKYLKEGLTCYQGNENSLIDFTLGQAYYDKGEKEKSVEFLQKAWDLSEGRAFQDEDPKYLFFLKK